MEAHRPYGTYVLQNGGEVVVCHLDGHDPRSSARFVHVDPSQVEPVKLMDKSEMAIGRRGK